MSTSVATTSKAIHVQGLSHQYRLGKKSEKQYIQALKDISFEVNQGEIFGILGPNGGGKTTLFKILTTMLAPNTDRDAGNIQIEINGKQVLKKPNEVRQTLGVVFQNPSLDGKLTARENLLHHGHLYGLSGKPLHDRIDQLLQQFGLHERRNDLVEHFSGGMKRKIEVAKAILHEPQILILDEPSTGLDPSARRDLWLTIHELVQKNGITVALTTHLMEEAEKCDRLAILSHGELVALDTPSKLKAMIGGDVITIVPENHLNEHAISNFAEEIAIAFDGWGDCGKPHVIDQAIHCEHAQGAEMVAKISGHFAGRIKSITVGQPTLEDVFAHLTGTGFTDEN